MTTDPTAEDRARDYATLKHEGQRYGDRPYTVHLIAVHQVAIDFGADLPVRVAAWLHDVIEDTDADRAELEAMFGDEVAALVWAVTGEGSTRAERVASMHRKVADAGALAAQLKLADRIANVEASVVGGTATASLLAMYRREQQGLESALWRAGLDRRGRRMLLCLQAALGK